MGSNRIYDDLTILQKVYIILTNRYMFSIDDFVITVSGESGERTTGVRGDFRLFFPSKETHD